jgi:hypothetical protein
MILALAVAVGIGLRLYSIGDQIIADDEFHALDILVGHDYGYVFSHFGIADHCIPLTLYDKFLADTIGLGEMGMRAPGLVAGIAAVLVLPILLRAYLSATTALVFAWLLAISPVHVYFSRYARPYSIVFLLAIVAIVACERWWAGGHRRWAFVYAICSAITIWFHLLYLPLVIGAFICLFMHRVWRARRQGLHRLALVPRRAWVVLASAMAGSAMLIATPLIVDFAAFRTRAGEAPYEMAPLGDIFELFSGARHPSQYYLALLLTLLGLVAMRRTLRPMLGLCAMLLAADVLAFVITSPSGMQFAIVFVRYALPLLAVVLIAMAHGMERVDAWLRAEWPRLPRHVAPIGGCLALFVSGPVWHAYEGPNNWTNHSLLQYGYSPDYEREYENNLLGGGPVPNVYKRLWTSIRRDDRIVEAPWCYGWSTAPYLLYQRVHQHRMLIGWVDLPGQPDGEGELPWPDERFRFQNFVHLGDFQGMRERKVRVVILHKTLDCGAAPQLGARLKTIAHWRTVYEHEFGPPQYEDDQCVLFLVPRGN